MDNEGEGPLGSDTPAQRFRRVAATFSDLVGSVEAGQWDLSAPCEGWVARDVIGHLASWVPSVIGLGGVSFADLPGTDEDPGALWLALASILQAALDDPVVAQHHFDVGPPGMMSVEAAIDMLVTGDVLVHTWDLATAIGQTVELDESVVAAMYDGMLPLDEMLRSSGHYGPKVEVPTTASTQMKLIAFTGRNPDWSPSMRGNQ